MPIGFVMDNGVKDFEPTEEDKNPQFSFGSDWKIGIKSMDEDFVVPGKNQTSFNYFSIQKIARKVVFNL